MKLISFKRYPDEVVLYMKHTRSKHIGVVVLVKLEKNQMQLTSLVLFVSRGLATGAGDNTTIVIVPTITPLALRLAPIIS